jgi:carbon storage regulator
MLVLSRKADQQIQIGPNITITILKVKGLAVRIGIDAPDDVTVMRTEVTQRLAAEAAESSLQEVDDSPKKRRVSPERGDHHPGETYVSPANEPSAESPRCRVPRLRLTPPDLHPLRSGPASAADGIAKMTAGGNLMT